MSRGYYVTQDYFIYNGKKYYSGTIILVKSNNHITHHIDSTEATFLYYLVNKQKYVIQIGNCTHYWNVDDFNNMFLGITEKRNVNINKVMQEKYDAFDKSYTFIDELYIDGLFVAWVWYIFIMAAATILKDRIGIWIFASIVFFCYRNKKLKERGHK